MPETWRAHVVRERLAADGIAADVRVSDVYALEGDERHAALDAIIAERAGFPMVIVGGVVACHDGVEMDAVLAVARSAARGPAPLRGAADAGAAPGIGEPGSVAGGCRSGGCC